MAHSLGNMVVSSYMNDYHQALPAEQRPNIVNYFMFNAAVALEAYLGDYNQYAEGKPNTPFTGTETYNEMVHPYWYGYQKRFAASEWYQLFGSNDPRRSLTWRNRFAGLPGGTNYYSFYSTGEDVLGTHTGIPGLFEGLDNALLHGAKYSWAFQEKWKGRAPFDGYGGTTTMGWGFNYEDALYNPKSQNYDGTFSDPKHLDTATANSTVSDAMLRSIPFFRKKAPEKVSSSLFDEGVAVDLQIDFGRERLLAKAIPALTTPTGGWSGEDIKARFGNIVNMNDPSNKNGWPSSRSNKDWRHSDIKDISYVYLINIFNKIVNSGGLK